MRAATLHRPFRRWPYRVAQFLRGFRTAVSPEDARTISALLAPAELQLFLAMRPRDRRHAVETMHGVEERAADLGVLPSSELLIAALLHDVGKGPLRIEDRVLYVVLRAISTDLVDHFACAEGLRWRVALWRLRHHAAVGAAQLRAVGAAPRVVELTEQHHEPLEVDADRERRWLLEADEAA